MSQLRLTTASHKCGLLPRCSWCAPCSEWFEAQANKLQQRKDAMLAEWQAQCEEVRKRKEAAQAMRAKAELDYANARTQQEFERSERALKDAIAALKEVSTGPGLAREGEVGAAGSWGVACAGNRKGEAVMCYQNR